MSKFKVGDKVFTVQRGWGIISSIKEEDTSYPIKVGIDEYTYDGRFSTGEHTASLFTKEEALQKFPEYPPPQRMKKITGYIRVDPLAQQCENRTFHSASHVYTQNMLKYHDPDWVTVEVTFEVPDND